MMNGLGTRPRWAQVKQADEAVVGVAALTNGMHVDFWATGSDAMMHWLVSYTCGTQSCKDEAKMEHARSFSVGRAGPPAPWEGEAP
jgi:hypothetical protein